MSKLETIEAFAELVQTRSMTTANLFTIIECCVKEFQARDILDVSVGQELIRNILLELPRGAQE